MVPVVDIHVAQEKARSGDLDGAIGLARAVVDDLFDSGGAIWSVLATTVLVEALLRRAADADLQEAQAAIDRLAAVPTDPGLVLHEIPLLRLRALLARARGEEAGYRELRNRYRARATECGFEGTWRWPRRWRDRGVWYRAAGRAKFCHECGAVMSTLAALRGTRLG